ncbi:MAG: EpsI family protein [Gemmatimonadetes bacterium]|nr:EpsI family protein [Gemmatimonadota bacterium]
MSRESYCFPAILLLLTATYLAANLSESRIPENLAQPLDSIPMQIGEWRGVDNGPLDERTSNVLKASSYLSRTYRKADEAIGLFVAFYAHQRAGETMHSPKNCLPGNGWEVWNYGTADIPVEGKTVTVNKYWVQADGGRKVILYWYQTPERIFASEYWGKLCLVWDALARQRTSGSIVRLVLEDKPEALREGISFASQMIPQMQARFSRE